MKFIHLSDLHLGKKLKEASLIEDQTYILNEILNIIKEEKPDGLIIAGDVYDKPIPPIEAVNLFDDFLTELSLLKIPSYIISGNHDSADRISFGSKLMEPSGIYFSGKLEKNIKKITLNDEFGKLNIFLLPFVKPALVKAVFEKDEIESYTAAVQICVEAMNINTEERNILVAHQFVTGAQTSESEEHVVGTLENVNGDVFSKFDYVALGHIHGPQKIMDEKIRYCGTPLKYSFSEVKHKKSLTVIELKEKNNVEISFRELKPLRDLRILEGKYSELMTKKNYENQNTKDFVHVVLTDENPVPEAFGKIQLIYENIVSLEYDNLRNSKNNQIQALKDINQIKPIDLLEDFFKLQNNAQMSKEQRQFAQDLIENIWQGEE